MIPASYIVKVNPRVITGGSNDLEMNGLVFSHNPVIPTDAMVLQFGSVNSVGAYFGTDSDEYAAAVTYFTGYVNKFSAPRAFFVARRVDEDVAGWMRTGPYNGTLAALKAVTDGAFVVTVDGTSVNVDAVDLSSATSFSDVAALIRTKLTPAVATVTYSSLNKSFTITSASTGEGKDVSFMDSPTAGTDLSVLLNGTQALGAITSAGSDTLSIDANMTAVRKTSENWVTFTTLWEPTIEEAMELAAWSNANYGWLYVAYTTDPNAPLQGITIDMQSILAANQYDNTCCVYGTLQYALFAMGTIASISWLRRNGTITLAFKSQQGIAPYVSDELDAEVLEGKGYNFYGDYATRNADFVFFYPGRMTASRYEWIDPYINSVWLNNRFQVALMDGLIMTGRAPYNERGYTMIRAWMQDPILQGLNNACIEPGVVLSEAQKSELLNEAGQDISTELFTTGYFLQILDPGAPVRAQRQSPIINFWYTYGGAVHRIEVASTAVL